MAPYEFDDAPADGNLYGRQNESWVEVSSAGAGPTGATGPQGAKGDTGLAGSPGIPRSAGATGPQGSTGSGGAAGATGPTGAQGSAGTPGTPGSAGATGPTGSVGASGGIGSTGATGPAGAGSPSNALPLMDGTATVGTSTNFAREGHIHPTDTSRAAVTYVDTQDALKVAKAGDTMTGLLVLSADPSAALGAATKQYADTKVAKAGDVMTGELIIRASPAWLALDKLASGTTSSLIGYKASFRAGRWILGDGSGRGRRQCWF